MSISDATAYNAMNTPLCVAEMLPTVGIRLEDGSTKNVENKLTTTLARIDATAAAVKAAVAAPTPVQVDAAAVAAALIANPDFFKGLAAAVTANFAARVAE